MKGSCAIAKKVSKFRLSGKMSKISYLFPNISGPDAYFSKQTFVLKPWVQAGRFEQHEPYNWKKFFQTYKVVLEFEKVEKIAVRGVQMKI